MVKLVIKQEVVNILTNFSKFEESLGELIRISAKLEQMNWSNIFGIFSELNAFLPATVIFRTTVIGLHDVADFLTLCM